MREKNTLLKPSYDQETKEFHYGVEMVNKLKRENETKQAIALLINELKIRVAEYTENMERAYDMDMWNDYEYWSAMKIATHGVIVDLIKILN